MTHDEIRELLGAYALYALMPEERAEVESHLKTCAPCRTDVAELEQVQEHLSLLAEERDPPPALRSRLMSIVEEDRRHWLETQTSESPAARVASERPSPDLQNSGNQGPAPASAVGRFLERLWRRLAGTPRLALGAASVAVVAVIAIGILLANRDSVHVVRTYACAVAQAQANGDTFTHTGCSVRIRSDHTIEVAFNDLPRLNARQAYELWALPAKGNPVPVAGITTATGGTFVKTYTVNPAQYAKAAISIERAPGNSPVPHGPVVFVLPLRG